VLNSLPKSMSLIRRTAYDKAVISEPPFEAVIHAASPYHFKATTPDAINELIDTAVNGTVGILQALKAKAPSVKRVVVTSSFAAMVDPKKPVTHKYSEKDWDPVTREEALDSPLTAYRASKTLAERAAWDFIEKEKPNFTLTTVSLSEIGPI
jgi:nucleoside-diphosphate-sugar epimerase